MTHMRAHTDLQEGRPLALDHMIGQERPVKQLRNALDAYVNDRAAMSSKHESAFPHVLLVGPSGVGKSSLSQILANELACKMHEELGQNLLGPRVVQGLLLMVEKNDLVFIDEIHELDNSAQTTLYRALEDRQLFLPSRTEDGEGSRIDLPPFTLIAATTDEYRLSRPLRDRFKLVIRLTHYSEDDLAKVVIKRSRRLGWTTTDAAARLIAKRGRGTPRIALRLLEAAWRTCRAEAKSKINSEIVRRSFGIDGIDGAGLDPVEQQYLAILHDSGGTSRLNIIATRMGLPIRTAMMFEQDLIRLGLVSIDQDSTRFLTESGRKHANNMK